MGAIGPREREKRTSANPGESAGRLVNLEPRQRSPPPPTRVQPASPRREARVALDGPANFRRLDAVIVDGGACPSAARLQRGAFLDSCPFLWVKTVKLAGACRWRRADASSRRSESSTAAELNSAACGEPLICMKLIYYYRWREPRRSLEGGGLKGEMTTESSPHKGTFRPRERGGIRLNDIFGPPSFRASSSLHAGTSVGTNGRRPAALLDSPVIIVIVIIFAVLAVLVVVLVVIATSMFLRVFTSTRHDLFSLFLRFVSLFELLIISMIVQLFMGSLCLFAPPSPD